MVIPYLNRSEQELVAHCIQATSYAGLARRLGISSKSAKRSQQAIYRKLGVTTSAELFSVALQAGMITVQVSTSQLKE